MTHTEKQIELETHKTLLLATLDYHIEHYTGGLVFDQGDPAAEYHLKQKQQTEKYFQQRRLDRLQKMLDRLLENIMNRADLHFASYIKEKTGYNLDVFEELRNQVAAIVAQKKIDNEEEARNVRDMLQFYQQTSADNEEVEVLKTLLVDFYERIGLKNQINKLAFPLMTNDMNSLVYEPNSPDGKRKVIVQNSGTDKYALTYVVIHLKGGSGSIYCARGKNLPIEAYWKDNSTIVIETKKDYIAVTQHHQVRSFQDVVKVEYSGA